MSKAHKKPDKPYADFPLFPHDNGQWAKKIRGKLFYFGTWNDPDGAAAFYERVRDDLYSGRTPANAHDEITAGDAANLFAAAKQKAFESGEISGAMLSEYKRSVTRFARLIGKDLAIAELGPSDFARLRESLSEQFENHVTLKNEIMRIRTLLRWCFDPSRIVKSPLPFGSSLKPPAARLLRKARAKQNRLWTREEIASLLGGASGYMKPGIYLGLNCGLGNRDICDLKWSHIKGDVLSFHRPKTGVKRRAILWKETLNALNEWRKESVESEFVCCRVNGGQFNESNTPIAHEFGDLMDLVKIERDGKGFYCLRHTYRTAVDACQDQPAILLTMGHADNTISGGYRQHLSDDRLRAVSMFARKELLGLDAE